MYELVERKLNDKESRLLKSKIRNYQKQIRSLYRIALYSALPGYGVAGLIILAGNLLSKEKTPVWFTLLIFLGAGTVLFVSVFRSLLRQNKDGRRIISVLEDALSNGMAREEKILCSRMVEIEELEDEGACYLFEIEDKRLFLLSGQEYYSNSKFPSTDFSLVDILDSNRNPVDSYIEKRGEKIRSCRIISARDKLKEMIPYDNKFLNCGVNELDSYLNKMA